MEMQRYHKEEKAIVLDFLPNGYPFDSRPLHMRTPVAQAIGKEHLSLLELVPKKDVFLKTHEEVYIGEGKRDQIHHVVGKISIDKLTSTARAELEFAIKDLIKADEKRFMEFFNNSRPLTTRMHQLELLPGIGKKHMWEIIEARKDKPFESFKDIADRVKLMPDPAKLVIRRILKELEGKEEHYIFVDI